MTLWLPMTLLAVDDQDLAVVAQVGRRQQLEQQQRHREDSGCGVGKCAGRTAAGVLAAAQVVRRRTVTPRATARSRAAKKTSVTSSSS